MSHNKLLPTSPGTNHIDLDFSSSEDEMFVATGKLEKTRLLKGGKPKSENAVESEYISSSSFELEEDVKYPKSVFFIVGNEFCERFSYYGMKAILTLYLRNELKFTEDKSTVLFHSFTMICYLTPIFGAIIADSILGKFKTILYISIVYLTGNAVLSIGSIPPLFPVLNTKIAVSAIGLLLIGIGTGGIKPCVSAFGGDQFVLPQQNKQLSQFFSLFYISINAGSLLSTLITPILRKDVRCFDGDCYSLAFGVPSILMFLSVVLFAAGTSLYKKRPPEGNVIVDVFKCSFEALKQKFRSGEQRDHWLDHAKSKCDGELIKDIKDVLKVLTLFLPLPVFWALFDQQGSRWTFQATRMDGNIGGWTIKPDQMQILNPLLILTLLPIFNSWLYPALARCDILKKPLTKMILGGLIVSFAFAISGFLEFYLENCPPNYKPNIMWQLPQYFFITVGEVLFSVTGIEFSFTQAPESMKSMIQAAWLSTVSMGNLIVVIIAEAKLFEKQSVEFFLFSGLMVIDMVIFIFLTKRYKYVDENISEESQTST